MLLRVGWVGGLHMRMVRGLAGGRHNPAPGGAPRLRAAAGQGERRAGAGIKTPREARPLTPAGCRAATRGRRSRAASCRRGPGGAGMRGDGAGGARVWAPCRGAPGRRIWPLSAAGIAHWHALVLIPQSDCRATRRLRAIRARGEMHPGTSLHPQPSSAPARWWCGHETHGTHGGSRHRARRCAGSHAGPAAFCRVLWGSVEGLR